MDFNEFSDSNCDQDVSAMSSSQGELNQTVETNTFQPWKNTPLTNSTPPPPTIISAKPSTPTISAPTPSQTVPASTNLITSVESTPLQTTSIAVPITPKQYLDVIQARVLVELRSTFEEYQVAIDNTRTRFDRYVKRIEDDHLRERKMLENELINSRIIGLRALEPKNTEIRRLRENIATVTAWKNQLESELNNEMNYKRTRRERLSNIERELRREKVTQTLVLDELERLSKNVSKPKNTRTTMRVISLSLDANRLKNVIGQLLFQNQRLGKELVERKRELDMSRSYVSYGSLSPSTYGCNLNNLP